MREIIIARRMPEDMSGIFFMCKESKDLEGYIRTAMRMRPDRITIDYRGYKEERNDETERLEH